MSTGKLAALFDFAKAWGAWELSGRQAAFMRGFHSLAYGPPTQLSELMEMLRTLAHSDAMILFAGSVQANRTARHNWRALAYVGGPSARGLESLTNDDVLLKVLPRLVQQTRTFDPPTAISDYGPGDRGFLDGLGGEGSKLFLEQEEALGLTALWERCPKLGAIALILPGYVLPNRYRYEELVLLGMNMACPKDGGGVRPFAVLTPCFMLLSAYLGRLESEFVRKLQIDEGITVSGRQLPGEASMWELYAQSTQLLAPFLDKDMARTTGILLASKGAFSASRTIPSMVEKARSSIREHYCKHGVTGEPRGLQAAQREGRFDAICSWAQHLHAVSACRRSLRHLEQNPRKWAETAVNVGRLAQGICDDLGRLPPVVWLGTNGDLQLDGPSLAAFLLCKIVECRKSGRLSKTTLIGGATDGMGVSETLLFLERLITVAQMALRARDNDMETLRALLWLVCEFGHDGLGIDRRIDLEKHLGLAAMEQPALFGLKRFYRDHLNHVIQVCLTGWLLLETRTSDGLMMWQNIGKWMKTTSLGHVLKQWFVASLLHDIGYVVEVGKGWSKLLDLFQNSSFAKVKENLNEGLEQLTSKALTQKEWGYQEKDKPGEDHGVVSAIHVAEWLETLGKDLDPGVFTPGILAMCHHNHHRPDIVFRNEPLTAWLVLCDELQEWDRPWMELDRVGLAMSAAAVYPGAGQDGWHQPLTSVAVNIKTLWDGATHVVSSEVTGEVLEFLLKYGRDVHRRDGVFHVWLGRSRALQRLKMDGATFNAKYNLNTPVRPPEDLPRGDRTEPQMERLRRLVREKRLWCVEKWLPREQMKPSGAAMGPDAHAVRYSHESKDDQVQEVVELNVRALGAHPPITGSMDGFWKAAESWSGAQEAIARDD